MKEIKIYTDGACSGNPGPGGWGALLESESQVREISGGELLTTNNRMELKAVIEALKIFKEPSSLIITTDSTYVQKGITEWIFKWQANGWQTSSKKEVKNKDLWQELWSLTRKHQISWTWIKGHSGHPQNEKCDRLARQEVDKYLKN